MVDTVQITELVSEACAEVRSVERRGWDAERLMRLEHLGIALRWAAVDADEPEAVDAALSVAWEIEDLLGRVEPSLSQRGAA